MSHRRTRKKQCPECGKKLKAPNKHRWIINLARHLKGRRKIEWFFTYIHDVSLGKFQTLHDQRVTMLEEFRWKQVCIFYRSHPFRIRFALNGQYLMLPAAAEVPLSLFPEPIIPARQSISFDIQNQANEPHLVEIGFIGAHLKLVCPR